MRAHSRSSIPSQWLPFIGNRLGLAKRLCSVAADPEDLDLHQVFPVTAPLARLLDDSREFEPRAGGTGVFLSDAISRAMGELLERYAALAFKGGRRMVASYKAMEDQGYRTVPFEFLTHFSREQLITAGFPYTAFTNQTAVAWYEGTDLLSGTHIYAPAQLLSLSHDASPDEVSTCFYSTSSGCALATSIEGAVLSGLLEAIERDAVMIRWYARLAPPVLELDPDAVLDRHLGLPSRGLDIRFLDMTVDGSVPVVGVTCVETTGRSCFFLLSAAAGLDTIAAARKALIEAGQGRPFVKMLSGMGDAQRVGDTFRDFDSNVRFYAEPSNAPYVEWFLHNTSVSTRHIPAPSGPKDPLALCGDLLERCAAAGLTPIAFDMTPSELREHGLFVCRVYVPELVPLCVPFAPFLGHPRLASAMAEAGCDRSAASIGNWAPHPFP
ncbi:MAG TPA: YcaO-like family protein [Acetobacteraceae bacterium]|jgi:ribosomal protein S12 methylthiotransferase accessory factor|nr:YcaO-like family protein [Acetobacteraceae bacterium]